ncbi:PKD domain-containing protein [Flavobacterium sp. RHBU_3]|uniref:PKD domain-containing protein n=1 Tax=Flavobacterium sp. RHBU_3 TaxID=3391184 RepID=UPI003984B461
MNTKLDNLTTQYRKFNAGQALTEGQLNEFIDYFEDQDRLSRTRLGGVGIICGFKSAIVSNASGGSRGAINISQGAGVTTDGDLVTLRKNELDGVSIDLQSKDYTYYRNYTDKYKYPYFTNGSTKITLLELFTDEEYSALVNAGEDETEFSAVNTIQNLEQKILLLFLETYSNDETPCESADCDNNGAEQVSELRVLLADSVEVDGVIVNRTDKNIDSIYKLHNSYEELYDSLNALEVKRVILDTEVVDNDDLRIKFKTAIESPSLITSLKDGFTNIANAFGIDLDFSGAAFTDILTDSLNVANSDIHYQYRYDLLKDLVDTYNEIRGLILHLKSVCCPDINSFPKHLMLGPVGASLSLGERTDYRHDFYSSPINTDADENKERLVLLANRFVQKINEFRTFTGPIKITPSNQDVALGEKAVPFYYNVTTDLLKKWNFDRTQTGKETYNLSYHTGNLSSAAFVQTPLWYNIDNHDFFRIEGHLGIPYKIALKNINNLKSTYGLAFDVVALVLKKGTTTSTTVTTASTLSINDLRVKLSNISRDVVSQTTDTQNTLTSISDLDEQLKLLNDVDFTTSTLGVSLVKQRAKEKDVVSELLSDFLGRNSGLEHVSGVPKGGTFYLIYESETSNKVIADFATPYLCCTKKDPVFLVLPATALCENDEKIPVTILPLDGEIRVFDGNTELTPITKVGGQNYFDPSLVGAAHQEKALTFTVNDDPVDTTIKVHAQPKGITFTIDSIAYSTDTDDPDATVTFKVTVPSGLGTLEYSWNYGDGTPVTTPASLSAGDTSMTHKYNLVASQEDTYNPTLTVTNVDTGCSNVFTAEPIKLIGQATVACLNNMRIVIQYKQGVSPSHGCNQANFNLKGNGIILTNARANPKGVVGNIHLSNTGGDNDAYNYPDGETNTANRYNEIIISESEAESIAAESTDGFISFSLECALTTTGCHTGVAWTQIFLADATTPMYDGYPTNNFLKINPCTGEVKP